jgi:hypothetical protein
VRRERQSQPDGRNCSCGAKPITTSPWLLEAYSSNAPPDRSAALFRCRRSRAGECFHRGADSGLTIAKAATRRSPKSAGFTTGADDRVRPAAVVRPAAARRLLSTIVIRRARALNPLAGSSGSSGAGQAVDRSGAIREIQGVRPGAPHRRWRSWVSPRRRRAWPTICGQSGVSLAPLGDGPTRRARPLPGEPRRRTQVKERAPQPMRRSSAPGRGPWMVRCEPLTHPRPRLLVTASGRPKRQPRPDCPRGD